MSETSFVLPSLGGLGLIIAIGMALLTLVIHLAFTVGVFNAAFEVERSRRVEFAATIIWALATLFGGVFVAVAFWLVHLSTLVPASSLHAAVGDEALEETGTSPA